VWGAKGWSRGGQPPWRRVARWRRTVNRWRLVTAGALAFTAPNPPCRPPPSYPFLPRRPQTAIHFAPPCFPPSFSSFTQAPAPWTLSLRSSKHNFAPLRREAFSTPRRKMQKVPFFIPFFTVERKKNQFPREGQRWQRSNRAALLLEYLGAASPARSRIKNTTVFLARRVPAPLITSGGRIASQIMRWAKVNEKVSRSRPDMIFPIKPSHFNIQHL